MSYASKKPPECSKLLAQGWTYLDVRTAEEFEQGHPAGAFNVPVMMRGGMGMQVNAEFAPIVTQRFAKDARLVVGCGSGGRSVHACEVLEAAGYTNLVNMECGYHGGRTPAGEVEPGWAALGLPSEGGQPKGRSYAELRAPAARRPA